MRKAGYGIINLRAAKRDAFFRRGVGVNLQQNWIAYLCFFIAGGLIGWIIKIIYGREIKTNICREQNDPSEPDLTGQSLETQSGLIEMKFPVIELLNAFLYVLLYKYYGFSAETFSYSLLVSLLLLIAFIDFRTMLIPNWTVLFILGAGLVFGFVSPGIPWLEKIIGLLLVGGILLLIALLSRGGLGGGDIKLMAAVGFFLGWRLALCSLFLASVTGGIIGIALLAGGKVKMKTEIPFGPILVAGIICSIVFGDRLIGWYLNQFIKW